MQKLDEKNENFNKAIYVIWKFDDLTIFCQQTV